MARAGDFRAHLVQAIRHIDDFGSRAAFSMTVVPFASVAAIIATCVPLTVTFGIRWSRL